MIDEFVTAGDFRHLGRRWTKRSSSRSGPFGLLTTRRLAIDWESGQQRGTMIIERGFGKIRSDTADPKEYHHAYALLGGRWEDMS
jgi:hypothetical protein